MTIDLIKAEKNRLDDINAVIESAIATWDIPERVKRLTLPSYRYSEMDLKHLEIYVAQIAQNLVGVVAWEPADINDTPNNRTGLLVHGLYVDPGSHRQGIGTRLFQAAEQAALAQGLNGLLVKAQPGAEDFFQKQGMTRLPVQNTERHYANRFWKPEPASQ